jgi:hypothetical protein
MTVELTPGLVRLLVERLFPVDDRGPAEAILDRYGSAPHEREALRVRVAALKLSGGKMTELERVIAHAKRDYRDVLAWAEYPEELIQPTWRLPEDQVARIRGVDRAQYLAWLDEHIRCLDPDSQESGR